MAQGEARWGTVLRKPCGTIGQSRRTIPFTCPFVPEISRRRQEDKFLVEPLLVVLHDIPSVCVYCRGYSQSFSDYVMKNGIINCLHYTARPTAWLYLSKELGEGGSSHFGMFKQVLYTMRRGGQIEERGDDADLSTRSLAARAR